MLMASLLFCAGCPQTTPEPVTCVDIRPPCSLPSVPVRPALPTAKAQGKQVALSLPDARKLWVYLERVRSWMRQAALCARSFEGKGRKEGGS